MKTTTFSRRDLLKAGGALIVGFSFAKRAAAQTPSAADATLIFPSSPRLMDTPPFGVINSISPSHTDSSRTTTNPSPPNA